MLYAILLKYLLTFLLAPIAWATGFRKTIIRRNLELMKLPSKAGFSGRLAFCAVRDLAALLIGKTASPTLSPRSKTHLEAMKKGPCLLLTAHFHNWEFFGSGLEQQGLSLLAAALPLKSDRSEQLLQKLRRRIGVTTVSREVPRNAIRHLQQGGCFGLLWDQHSPGSSHSGFFFGLPVSMNPLPFFLLNQNPCGVYFGILLPNNEIRLVQLMSRFEEDWEHRLIRRYHRMLEMLIRQHPEYWYGFFHARFKSAATYRGHRLAKTIAVPA